MMDRLRLLLREPALLIDAFESGVVVAVALGLFSLHGEQQRDLIALFIAVLALLKGITTKPFPVTVIPDLGRAALVFFCSVQVTHLSADQITLVATFLGTLMTLLQRSQITPVNDPVTRPGGAGAGPVTTEAGAVEVRTALVASMFVGGAGLFMTPQFYVAGIILLGLGFGLCTYYGWPARPKDEAGYVATSAGVAIALIVLGLVLWLLTGYALLGIILIVVGLLCFVFWR